MRFQHKKFIAVLATVLCIIAFLLPLASIRPIYDKDELTYGVTFSPPLIEQMGLNWQEAYLAILDDLRVKKLRVPAYWDRVEAKQDIFSYEDIDWQVAEAAKRDVEVILAVGGRLPRWPECHFPDWSADLPADGREAEIIDYVAQTISRYRDNKTIVAWQIENEPFLPYFGKCPRIDSDFLDAEIALARSLDSSRPIIVTDSGELSIWLRAAKRADIFGTTLYRDTYSSQLGRYIHYPFPAGFFRLKQNLTEFFVYPKPREIIVIELQAEPWGPKANYELTKAESERTMSLEKFKDTLEYSRQAGFREFYLWGVEWWYWQKEVQGDPAMWNEAKKLF